MNNATTIHPISSWERLKLHPSFFFFSTLLIFVGIPGNSLILFIYTKRIRICIYGFFIKTLAVLDFISCIGLSAYVVHKLFPVTNNSLMCKYFSWSRYVNFEATGCLYVLIAVHRYWKICRPQSFQISESLAKKLTFGCVIFCLITGFPILLIVTGVTSLVEWKALNQTGVVEVQLCDFTDEIKRMKVSLAFSSWMLLLLLVIIISLIVLYVIIVGHLRKHALKGMSVSQNQTSKLTVTFFSLTVIYLLTIIPGVILDVYFSLSSNQTHLMVSRYQINDIVIPLPFINCIVNPFVYGFTTRRFRHEARSLVWCLAVRDHTSSSQPDVHTDEIISDHIPNPASQSD